MQQDWIMGLIGGGLIGAGAAVFLLVNGRIMGASGIVGGLIDGSGRSNLNERLVFIAGLIGVPALVVYALGVEADTHVTDNLFVVALAGLLVGVGTRLANGCTSGHGVCGISRLNFRGIVATVFYIMAGGLAVLFSRHLLGIV